MKNLKDYFLLDPEIIFLNHGSYGSCPEPVFTDYQKWQRNIEKQPVDFFTKQLYSYLKDSRVSMSSFIGCEEDSILFFPNPTTAVSNIIHSLKLEPSDEILMTNHEYGALIRALCSMSNKTGVRIVQQEIPIPLVSKEKFKNDFWSGVSDKTKVIFISHITSPTALILPIKEIIQMAKSRGILTIVDGAHVPGHIPLNINDLGCDFYTGALHKWLCMPKGTTFLYVKKAHQNWVSPIVKSWGDEGEDPGPSNFLKEFQWQGTNDLSSFLTVPSAINFYNKHIKQNKNDCFLLASEASSKFNQILGTNRIYEGGNWIGQMVAHPLPKNAPEDLKDILLKDFKIEIPIFKWNGIRLIRASFQIYNDKKDLDSIVNALSSIF